MREYGLAYEQPDPREAKLPLWARQRLAGMRSWVAHTRDQMEEAQAAAQQAIVGTDPSGTDTVYVLEMGATASEVGLPRGQVVRFKLGPRQGVDAQVVDGRLELSAHRGQLVLRGRFRNEVHVQVEP